MFRLKNVYTVTRSHIPNVMSSRTSAHNAVASAIPKSSKSTADFTQSITVLWRNWKIYLLMSFELSFCFFESSEIENAFFSVIKISLL
jgi:hypothetical protein